MNEQRSLTNQQQQQFKRPNDGNFNYMTEDQLTEYLNGIGGSISKPEIERMYLSRRRLSIELKKEKPVVKAHSMQSLLEASNCTNSYPYKIVILGDETYSAKQEVFHLFTLLDIIKKNPKSLDFANLPPCDIQTQIFQVKETDSNINRNYALEFFLPFCDNEYNNVRPLYYPATDAFVLVFSIKSYKSFNELKNKILPEVRHFIDHESKFGDIPIILVGNHAEVRENENYNNETVQSQEAVDMAHEFQASKYIEIFSENLFHIHEIFQQTVHAINYVHSNSKVSEQERKKFNASEDKYFRDLLTVPTPEGEFDQFEKFFEINALEGVDYYFTMDEEEPSKISKHYLAPIKLKKPYPKAIKVIALERCKYASEIAIFEVPQESSEPIGVFDPITKGFHIVARAHTMYFMTTDGSKPVKKSMKYNEPGLFFDDNPNACFLDSPKFPPILRVVAVEQNKFKSKVKNFKPYEILAPPSVHFSDNMLRIDTIPGIVYKYTLDGTVPNYYSATYTRPVMLARTADIKSVRIAAFPKLYFCSKMVELQLPQTKSPAKKESSQQNIKMTKSAMQRMQQVSSGSPNSNSPRKQINQQTSPRTYLSPISQVKKTKENVSHKKPEEKSTNRQEKANNRNNRSTEQKAAAKEQNKGLVATCRAEGTNVEFKFNKQVLVSRITIKTPGQKMGPDAYEIYVVGDHGELIKVASGKLKDILGEQAMELSEQFLMRRLKKLLCTFQTPKGQKTFKILDMKVDYRLADIPTS
jgi:hypothetical protein